MAIDLRRQTGDSAKHIINAINSMADVKKAQIAFQQNLMLDKIERERKLDTRRKEKEMDLEFQGKEDKGLVDMLSPQGAPATMPSSEPTATPTAQNRLPAMSATANEGNAIEQAPTQSMPQSLPSQPTSQDVTIDGVTFPPAETLLKAIRASGGKPNMPQLFAYKQAREQFARGEGNEGGKNLMFTALGIKPKTSVEKKLEIMQQEKAQQKEKQAALIKDQAASTLNTIAEIKNGIRYFGAMGNMPPLPAEYEKKNWEANLNKLRGNLVINLMSEMKQASKTGATGFGQLSNKELKVLQDSATALNKGLSEEDAQKYLEEIKTKVKKVLGVEETTEDEDYSELW